MRKITLFAVCLMYSIVASAQENLQRGAKASGEKKTFTTVKENPITRVELAGTMLRWDTSRVRY